MNCRSELSSWQALEKSAESLKQQHLKTLFANDNKRFEKFSTQVPGLLFDFSKQLIDDAVFSQLIQLAEQSGVATWRVKMFSGEKINITENRAVLHTALRNRSNSVVEVDGEDVMPLVNAELAKIKAFTEKVRSGEWLGYTGKPV